ncbi:MAG: two-component regulator propeller domain-containing protein [Flavobacteriales bacterium]
MRRPLIHTPRTFASAFAFFTVATTLWGQAPAVAEVIHLDIKGLPAASIRALAKDREGFLWIGTENGLCRYDGINVDVYRNIPSDSTSLPGNYIHDLVLANDGRLWVSSFGGIAVFDPHMGEAARGPRFQRKALFAREQRFPAFEAVDLAMDNKGGLWAACVSNGLARYDQATDMFREVRQLSDAMPAEQTTANVLGATCDADGMIWAVGWLCLYRIDPTTGGTTRFTFSSSGHTLREGALLYNVVSDPVDPGILWLRSWGLGLVRFDKRTGTFQNYTISHGGPVNLTNIVWSVLPQRDGRILVGIDKELHWFDTRTRTFSGTFNTFEWKTPGFDALGYALLQDESDRIWVGTTNGIFILPGRSSDFRQWPTRALILCVAVDHPGYWGARQYARRALLKIGPSGELLDSLLLPELDEERTEPISILQTRDGRVLIGTTRGLRNYDPGTRRLSSERFESVTGLPDHPPGILSMAEAEDGSVWIAFNGSGLLRYPPQGASPEWVEPQADPQDPGTRHAWNSVMIIGGNKLAVTFEDGGLGVIDPRTKRLVEFTASDPEALSLGRLAAITSGADGQMYAVTTNDGLVHLRYDGTSIQHAATYEDMQDRENGYNDAAMDATGNIWIASNTGLVLFSPADSSFQHIGPLDGLGMSSVASVIADKDGYTLAWNKLTARFKRSTFPDANGLQGLYIRSVLVHGDTGGGKESGTGQESFTLSHDRNSITISYAPIALLHADAVRYEVMLEGHDANWVDNGYQRSVSYVGLPPGSYVFKVVAGRGTATAKSASIAFTIVPAFWQTWWFKLLVILIAGFLVFLISRYILSLRYRQRIAALEHEREVGAVRTRIARDIHDDIGSGLTRITMLSRAMSGTTENNGEKEHLADSIATASTELIGQLSEIVFTVDPKNDHAERFVAYVRDLLGRQFEELQVELRTDLSIEPGMEHRDIPPEVKRNTVMILKETVSNALKHADARTITVELHIGAGELRMIVADDGHGFDQTANGSRGNGLGNLRNRSEAIGGTLEAHSDATGTRYALHVPLPSPTFMRGE